MGRVWSRLILSECGYEGEAPGAGLYGSASGIQRVLPIFQS